MPSRPSVTITSLILTHYFQLISLSLHRSFPLRSLSTTIIMHAAQVLSAIALFATAAIASPLEARATCTTVTVVSGDGCGSLAKKCGISAANFTKYNPKANLCSTLMIDQRVCCTAGDLPDIRPKPNKDGTCAKYTVQEGDWCGKIASANGISTDDIEKFNDSNPDWQGCADLWADIEICVSSGPFSL